MKPGAYWDKNPTDFGESVHAFVYERSRQAALSIFDMAVSISPVDTGAYRASWFISEGQPEYKWVGRQPRNSSPLPPPIAPKLSTKFYRKFYVTNGAPYAVKLEYGWSGQAPQGILRQALRYGV